METVSTANALPREDAAGRFEAWVSPARVRPELWRLALGLLLALAVWILAAAFVVFAASAGNVGKHPSIIGLLLSSGGLILGVWLAARSLHGRSFASLIGPGGFRPRAFAAGMSVVAGVVAAAALLAALLDPPERQMALDAWAVWLPLMAPVLLVQVSAEELAFRGYLQQQLAARFRSRLVWLLLPAALFGVLHWNPALGPNAWLAAAAAGVTGLVYGDVAARAGNISVSIGLHFANNVVAMLVWAVPGPISGFSLYVDSFAADDVAAMRMALIWNMALTAIAYGIYRAVLAWRARSLHSKGPSSI